MDDQLNFEVQPVPEQPEVYTQPVADIPPQVNPQPAVEQPVINPRPAVEQPLPKSPFADSPYQVQYQPQYQPPQPKAPKKKSKAGKVVLAIILAAALIVVSSAVTAALVNEFWEEKMELLSDSLNNKLDVMQAQINGFSGSGTLAPAGDGLTPGQVYAQNVRAVVAVSCNVQQYDYFGPGGVYQSFGSGFIISQDGYVISNHHVVEGATSVTVTTSDGKEYAATVVGVDSTNDVSLLKMEGENFPYVQIGSSAELAVGDQVVAIGNPLGELTSTLTVGYVSAKDRVVTTDGTTINMLQTDAAINSGNSGGPLFNIYGEVVGITTAKYSGTSQSGASIEGIGFAIPMDDVIGIVEDLQIFGYVKGAYLGVYVRDVSADGIRDGLPAGALIEEVTPGYCAEAAGLKVQDIVVDLGGHEVTCTADLTRALRKFEPGDTTTITVYRKGNELVLNITLSEKPVIQETVEEVPTQPQEQVQTPTMDDWYKKFFEDFFD